MDQPGQVSGHSASNAPKWKRVVSRSLVFLSSLGGIVTVVVVAAVVAVVVIVIPGSGSTPSRGSGSPASPPATVVTTLCGQGPLQIIGSTAFMPIAQEAASAYMDHCPGAKITVTDGDSAFGLGKVHDAVASGSPQAGSTIAMYDGNPTGSKTEGLKAYPEGALIFSVVAHTGLFPGEKISTAELHNIFVKPGEPGKVAVGRLSGSGSRLTFITKVLGINDLGESDIQPDRGGCSPPTGGNYPAPSCTAGSTQGLLAFVNKTPNAIGYAEAYESLAAYPGVSVLDIDNAQPTAADVINGSYKYWIVEHLWASAQPTALTKDFLGFLPNYFTSNPRPGFIACSQLPKQLNSGCP